MASLLLPRHTRRLLRPLLSALSSTRAPLPSPPIPIRLLHDTATTPDPPPAFFSRILQSDPNPAPGPDPESEDEEMNEFLSRFVHEIRGKLRADLPDITREELDKMLVLICNKVISCMDPSAAAADQADPDTELSSDLWATIWEVSTSVRDNMRRDRIRTELRKYIHCDEVNQMCRFAAEVGMRAAMLREFRFKWAAKSSRKSSSIAGWTKCISKGGREMKRRVLVYRVRKRRRRSRKREPRCWRSCR